ncbi:hypothetical protein EZV62_006482 [Acer yangbiense]|uniref:PPM-type phosphatase domain-containing protein n=1 Tax=Acer yangbiense TaxID=1000413 RepID=A0A5C7I7T0_9ROSI|nr:hypothetical protein EZV62_006482 [Acer yangbiense]
MRKMKREMRVMKREMREMKRLIETLSKQGTTADWNENPRTSLDHQIKKSEQAEFQLQFANKLPNTIYTKDKIRDESDGSIQIKLVDTISRETVKVGVLSSIEIGIVVLEGNFGFKSHENWIEQEFNDKIVHQRGEKPLLKGKQNIMLTDGVGSIDDLKFSVNSSWTNCKKFRLGARVLKSSNMGQVRIKEAITEAFTVRDQRGKMLHLEKIKEGGKFHKALIDNDIRSGSKLKEMYKNNPGKLRMILKGCSKWEWDVIVHHASCVLDDANSNPSRSLEAEANNTATTGGPPFRQFQSIQQGSTGMQNNSNHASSSQYLAENFQNSASQHPPSLDDEVRHLKKIKRGGKFHTRLIDNDIQTIRNFKQMYKTNPIKLREILKDCSDPDWEVMVQHADGIVDDDNSNLLRSQEAEAYNTATTCPPFSQFQSLYQGSSGMQNDSNLTSSSQCPPENFQYLTPQPLAMSTPPSHVNVQLTLSNDNHLGWNSSQFNELNLFPLPNTHLMRESSQINNGQHCASRDEWLQALPRALVAGETSETMVTFVVIDGWTVTVASVGDSRCILDTHGGVVSLLTVDYRLEENVEERERVTASGGEVGRLNVFGGNEPEGLCLSRSIGDTDVGEFIVPVPHVKQVKLSNAWGRLVIASDGIWDALSSDMVAQSCRGLPAELAAKLVVKEALRSRGLKDDTTYLVVDIIPSDHPAPAAITPWKKHNMLSSLLFGTKKALNSTNKASNKLSPVGVSEELCEDSSAMLAERLGKEFPLNTSSGLFIFAVCQVDQPAGDGLSVNSGHFFSPASKPWEGPFLCTNCRRKKDAMEGMRPSCPTVAT